MWEQVKPITLILEQENADKSRFVMHLYSYDFELVKIREAFEYDANNKLTGEYSRFSIHQDKVRYTSNYFVERLSPESKQKIVEYYENSNIFVEYFI